MISGFSLVPNSTSHKRSEAEDEQIKECVAGGDMARWSDTRRPDGSRAPSISKVFTLAQVIEQSGPEAIRDN